MKVRMVRGGQRGATHTEYAIIIAAVSLAVMAGVALLGGNVPSGFCGVSQSLGSGQDCASAAPAGGADASGAGAGEGGSGTAAGAPAGGSGSGSGAASGGSGSGSGAASGGSGATVSGSGSDSGSTGGSGGLADTPTDQAATNSAGTMTYYTAVVDQDQRKRDLSARFNIGWSPDSWSGVVYPDSLTVDVTWSPALEVDQVITGSSGHWDYTLVAPGHLRLTRSGALDTRGFNPEPEILLTKPATAQNVSVTFTATAPNSPSVSATSTTRSTPYK